MDETLIKANENALFEFFQENKPACEKKREFENIFDNVIKTEILPFASKEQINRLYEFYMSLYKIIVRECGEEERKDITNINNWYGNKANYLPDYEYDMVISKIKEMSDINDLKKYKEYLDKTVLPVASIEQIKNILKEYDTRYRVLKRMEEEKEKMKNIEKLIDKFRIGMKVRMNRLYGTVIDISTTNIRVEFENGYKAWVSPEKLEIL